jgi:hypothetical protein
MKSNLEGNAEMGGKIDEGVQTLLFILKSVAYMHCHTLPRAKSLVCFLTIQEFPFCET